MKLYIKFGSLAKFQRLYDSNEYLQAILTPTSSNVYFIETDDLSEVRRLLIGNNIKFDINVVEAELRRDLSLENQLNIDDCLNWLATMDKVDTMTSSVDLCAIVGPYGFKWPKLDELHVILFGTTFDGAHDAGADVAAVTSTGATPQHLAAQRIDEQSARALHEAGAVTKQTMREFDAACLTPVEELSPEDIRQLREREHLSQPVFARYLNVSKNLISDWERGVKKPGGPALRLLTVIQKKGLLAIA